MCIKKDYKALFLKSLYFRALPIKLFPSGSNTFLEADLSPLDASLEFFFCDVLQCAPYSSQDVVYCLEIMFSNTNKGKCKGVFCKDLTTPTSPGSATYAVIREYQL